MYYSTMSQLLPEIVPFPKYEMAYLKIPRGQYMNHIIVLDKPENEIHDEIDRLEIDEPSRIKCHSLIKMYFS